MVISTTRQCKGMNRSCLIIYVCLVSLVEFFGFPIKINEKNLNICIIVSYDFMKSFCKNTATHRNDLYINVQVVHNVYFTDL